MSTETTRVPQQKDSAAAAVTEPVLSGPTMIRWSSDPASLSSSSSSGNSTVAGNTVNSARCAIIALQREVNIARERCRKLEIDLAAERDSSSASLSAIVQCVEQKQAENLQLQATVWKQRKHILKLRRQLLAAGTQLSGASVHAIPSEDSLLDLDNDFSDSELGLVNVPCISQENQRRAVTSSWGEPTDMVNSLFQNFDHIAGFVKCKTAQFYVRYLIRLTPRSVVLLWSSLVLAGMFKE